MKKRNLFVSLGLVATLGVGATLAYLTANTEELTNKFTFTSNGISIKLDEAIVEENKVVNHDKDRVSAGKNTGNDYFNLEPNQILPKDPTVTVGADSVDCLVVVSVENANGDKLTIKDLKNDVWQELTEVESKYKVTPADNTKYYIYVGNKATKNPETDDTYKVIPSSNSDTTLEDIFTQVQVGNLTAKDIEELSDRKLSDIVIKAAAVQANNATDTQSITEALNLLKGKN